MRLCSDKDIFKWEPALFTAAPAERFVLRGTQAQLSSTTFTDTETDFLLTAVAPASILRLWNTLAQVEFCCEVVSLGESGELVVSAIRPDDITQLWSPGNYSNLDYAVVSYASIIEEVSYYLLSKFGLLESADNILNDRQLKLCCVFAVISACYASVALSDTDSEDTLYWAKSNYYRKRFEEHRSSLELLIDIDGDGNADDIITTNSIALERN